MPNRTRINASPYERAWMIKLRVANPAEADSLLTAADYQQHVATSGH